MSFFVRIRDWLADPRLAKIDIESDDHLRVHREILSESGLTRDVFQGFYTLCRTLDDRYFSGGTRRVEIGAGLSFFKEVYAENISSDFKCAAGLDLVIDTQRMAFKARSLRTMYGINCFHHFTSSSQKKTDGAGPAMTGRTGHYRCPWAQARLFTASSWPGRRPSARSNAGTASS